jgi:methyl-accepting chemotaxis protein
MTPKQVEIVQSSWQELCSNRAMVPAAFYSQLFTLDPSLRSFFHEDLTGQYLKFQSMMETAIGSLGDLDALLPAVRGLGRRHALYGVTTAHYEVVGDALIRTLRAGLAANYSASVEEAWLTVFNTLATTMQEAKAD